MKRSMLTSNGNGRKAAGERHHGYITARMTNEASRQRGAFFVKPCQSRRHSQLEIHSLQSEASRNRAGDRGIHVFHMIETQNN